MMQALTPADWMAAAGIVTLGGLAAAACFPSVRADRRVQLAWATFFVGAAIGYLLAAVWTCPKSTLPPESQAVPRPDAPPVTDRYNVGRDSDRDRAIRDALTAFLPAEHA